MFRTPISTNEIQSSKHKIDYQSNILLVGSCFVENIGQKLAYFKFNNRINPYGILFHPLAILQLFQDVKHSRVYTDEDLIFHNELWHSMNHHSDISHPDKSVVLEQINKQITETKQYLNQASHIIITLGTAWVYHFIERDTLVANCHKIPANRFVKRLLSVNEIQSGLETLVTVIRELSTETDLILTLSPVRHLKDGMINNMLSKAHLLTAIHNIINQTNTYYFPAYDIMMDDLRDYRFYTDDMLHPNTLAIDYIWDVFKTTWLNEDTENTMFQVDKVQKGIKHRPNFPETEAYQRFLKHLEQQQEELKTKYGIVF